MTVGYNIAGVQFRRAGKIYDFTCGDIAIQVGDQVVVDTERGPSMARVAIIRYEIGSHDLKPILRKPSKYEMEKPAKVSLEEVISYTRSQINQYELDMKILTADIQFGGNKITIYFSSPGRVDFRDLVKALATGLKARVELKQVGSRDETKLIGGIGICGREYCCSSFLREFVPVSIRMAKNQNLALNPNKVSGGCGRLLCCLTYEDQVYTDLRKILPPRGTRVRLLGLGGLGDVLKGDILNQLVLVETDDGQQVSVAVSEIEVVSKAEGKLESQEDWGGNLDLDALSSLMDESPKNPDGKGPRGGAQRDSRGREAGRSRENESPRSRENADEKSRPKSEPRKASPYPQGQGKPEEKRPVPAEGGERSREGSSLKFDSNGRSIRPGSDQKSGQRDHRNQSKPSRKPGGGNEKA